MKKLATPFLLSIVLLAPLANAGSSKAELAGNAALVQAAYADLTSADHDYDGHRAAAAKKVKGFSEAHKITLTEGVKGTGEAQEVSDGKLHDALIKLQEVVRSDDAKAELRKRKAKEGKEHDRRLVEAIADIKTALKVK